MEHLGDYVSDDDHADTSSCRTLEGGSNGEVADQIGRDVAGTGKRRVDYKRLPVSRPLPGSLKHEISDSTLEQEIEPDMGLLQTAQAEQCKLKIQKESETLNCASFEDEETWSSGSLENSESELESTHCASLMQECSSVATECQTAPWLPAPKHLANVPGNDVQIDFESAGKPKEKPCAPQGATSWLVQAATIPDIVEAGDIPESILAHPMLSAKKARRGGASWEDLQRLRSLERVKHIHADSMKDANWHASDLLSGSMGLHLGKKVPLEASMYDSDQWQASTHANPSKTQKRKHQINWLAHEAIEKEAELLDRSASSRLTKAQTASKYGW